MSETIVIWSENLETEMIYRNILYYKVKDLKVIMALRNDLDSND